MTDYKPSEAAKNAFYKALDKMAMHTYHELPSRKHQQSYAIGFCMGYEGLPFPKEAVECRAMDDGFMFGARASHKGYEQREDEPIKY